MLRVCGKGTKIVLVPLPPAVGRAIDRAVGLRDRRPIQLNTRGARMDRHAATRRLRHLAATAGLQIARAHPLSRPGARFWCCHRQHCHWCRGAPLPNISLFRLRRRWSCGEYRSWC